MRLPVGTALDGELFVAGDLARSSNDAVAHLIGADPNGLDVIWFDCLWFNWMDLRKRPFRSRRGHLEILESAYPHPKVLWEELLDWDRYEQGQMYVEDGGEGLIFKLMDGPASVYRPGSRSNCVKWKPQGDPVDAVITSADQPVPRWKNNDRSQGESSTYKKGFVVLGYGYLYEEARKWDGGTIELDGHRYIEVGSCGMSGPPEEMQKHVGRVVELGHWGVYKGGALRHPQIKKWRNGDDKAPWQCEFPEPTIPEVEWR